MPYVTERAGPSPGIETTAILENMSDAFYALDRDWCLTYINQSAERFWGRARRDLLGRSIWSVLPQMKGSEIQHALELVATDGEPRLIETISPVAGVPVELNIIPTPNGT